MFKSLVVSTLLLLSLAANAEVIIFNIYEGATVRANGGIVEFIVSADEPYRLFFDGYPAMISTEVIPEGEHPGTMNFTAEAVSRGEHVIQIDTMVDGEFVHNRTINFTVQRVSKR